ncbi:MAG: carboxynorspermidine decarboxylase [Verrucomicrobiales bacterium]|jgi:carboxynorspermidine decarboxylase
MPQTPYYLISESRLLENLRKIERLRDRSGAKIVLALKCFSTWGVFPIMRPFLDGTTSSSLYEAKLGHETFGGETHAYSVAFSAEDIDAVDTIADKCIFNSATQLASLASRLKHCRSIGLRVNPQISYSSSPLSDPALPLSRLGVRQNELSAGLVDQINGAMFHFNCENAELDQFLTSLAHLSLEFGEILLDRIEWVSLGGGVLFTADGYPIDQLADALRAFSEKHSVQVYLEPGEAVITKTTDLIVTILDIVQNDIPTAIVDSATETHRLDTLVFNEPASIREATSDGEFEYVIGASSCLAGDVFCRTRFPHPLQIGDRLQVLDSGGYTMVKTNWFNGLKMPGIWIEHENGQLESLNEFDYADFKRSLSLRMVGDRNETGS